MAHDLPLIYTLDFLNADEDLNTDAIIVSEKVVSELQNIRQIWHNSPSFKKIEDLKFQIFNEISTITYKFNAKPNHHTEVHFFESDGTSTHRGIFRTPYPVRVAVVKNDYTHFFCYDLQPFVNITWDFGKNIRKASIFMKNEETTLKCENYGIFKCHIEPKNI